VLLSSTLILVIALITENIQRRFPLFWFQPAVSIPATPSPALGGPETDVKHTSSTTVTIGESTTSEAKGENAINAFTTV